MEKMSRPLPLNPTFIPPPYGVLRSLLENPLKLPLHHEDAFGKDKDKEKKLDDESNSPTVPQSAFLGPTLWDKTLPYDGDTFQLEYMDLEEFLSENGIPPSPSQHDHSPHPPGLQPASSAAPSVMDLSSRASAPIHPGIPSPNCMQSPIRPGQLLPANRNTPSPIDPDTIQVPVGYEPDPADLALSSIPGQEMFDPRKRKFSEEELKPQPMIKKARKVFIPDDLKFPPALSIRNNVTVKILCPCLCAHPCRWEEPEILEGEFSISGGAFQQLIDLAKSPCNNIVWTSTSKHTSTHGRKGFLK
ncbi:hepatic leukemia factor isoform X4 [Mirounga angustirostris]|uniref:hepatic leukemia factor isoform X4 n=1 Tax=Mirounga angustirostris TaxID=9716 RepID=UPI00313F0128